MDKKKGKLLIVDDNIQILNSLNILLKNEFSEITLLKNPSQIPSLMRSCNFDLILLDMNFKAGENSGNEGLFWLSEILKADPQAIVLMITAYGEINLAVKAIKAGATDFISKPWDAEKLLITLNNAIKLRNTGAEVKKLRSRQAQMDDDINRQYALLKGSSGIMNNIYKTIDKVAPTEANILILGENGTGKEVIAREIHRKSHRASEIFLAVDMGSISESLFESEMFGHIKGAFTDAKEDRAGRFETASGGTLFLDEIANLTLASQSRLLSALQNKQINRVGSSLPVPLDIRLITATNANPAELVNQNRFREDLLFRINTIQIEIPPLRKRREDIRPLADFFLMQYASKYGKKGLKINDNAYKALENYHWSGNIRELKHTIEKAIILCESSIITVNDLALKDLLKRNEEDSVEKLSDIERKAINRVMDKCQGNVSQAAKILDISRTTLYSKLKQYDI